MIQHHTPGIAVYVAEDCIQRQLRHRDDVGARATVCPFADQRCKHLGLTA